MQASYALLGCVVLVWGCVDTELPASPPIVDAGLAAWNTSKGATKPPVAPQAGQGGARAPASRAQAGADLPAAIGGGGGASPQPTAAGAAAGRSSKASAGQLAAVMQSMPTPLHVGDLVITELMIDPKTLTDNEGEWIELYNTTQEALELRGCELDDGSKSPHAISQMLHVAATGYITLARQASPGFMPSAVMPLSLTNSQDAVAIRCNGVEIDRVHYDARAGSPLSSGASLALDPGELSAAGNDPLDAWCAATESYGPELGSPGRANPPCHPDVPDAGTEPDSEPEPEPEE